MNKHLIHTNGGGAQRCAGWPGVCEGRQIYPPSTIKGRSADRVFQVGHFVFLLILAKVKI